MSFATKPAAAAIDMTPSNRRFLVMALLFVTVVINYLDRSNLSIAAPSITSEFGLNPVQLGVVFSAFGWTYTPLQIPGGWLVDRVHPRVLYPLTIFFWSIATLCLGRSTGLVMLIILRMTVRLLEVPSFLINFGWPAIFFFTGALGLACQPRHRHVARSGAARHRDATVHASARGSDRLDCTGERDR